MNDSNKHAESLIAAVEGALHTPIEIEGLIVNLASLATEYDGLTSVSKNALETLVEPIRKALDEVDAVSLLGLQPPSELADSVIVRDGIHAQPIHRTIIPARDDSAVRYLRVGEKDGPSGYSIGIFVFAPGSKIPLHDHPGMCVLSRVLYGELHRTSLDLEPMRQPPRRNWLPWSTSSMPEGTQYAYRNTEECLVAPATASLFPFEGNLHEFSSGPTGAAVLDVLVPPYDHEHDRDCTFYTIQDDASDGSGCWVIPTEQPEDFHCISGTTEGF